MKYTIQKIEQKDFAGGLKRAVLLSEAGVTTKEVTFWPDFPNYSSLKAGDEVEGIVEMKKNGKYTNYTIKPDKGGSSHSRTSPSVPTSSFQTMKDAGIMMSSTVRMATDIVIARGVTGMTDDEIKTQVMKWRFWLVEKWGELSKPKIGGTNLDYPNDTNPDDIPF